MNRVLLGVLASFFVSSFVPAAATAAPDRVYDAVVTGISCKGCARELSDLLTKIEGVKSIEVVDVKAGKATITMKGEATLDKAAVEKALKGSKFGLTSLEEKKAAESKPKG
jgi:copper chaperone CopZ